MAGHMHVWPRLGTRQQSNNDSGNKERKLLHAGTVPPFKQQLFHCIGTPKKLKYKKIILTSATFVHEGISSIGSLGPAEVCCFKNGIIATTRISQGVIKLRSMAAPLGGN